MAKVMAVEHIWASECSEADVQLYRGLVPDENHVLLATLMRWRRLTCTLEDTEELLVDVQWVIPSTALDRYIPDFKRVELRPEQWNRWIPDLVIDGLCRLDGVTSSIAKRRFTCRPKYDEHRMEDRK